MNIERLIAELNNPEAIKKASEDAMRIMAVAESKTQTTIMSLNRELAVYRDSFRGYSEASEA